MKKFLVCIMVLLTGLSACKKSNDFDPDVQDAIDDKAIQAFIAAKQIPAQKHASGLYYVISNPGSGSIDYKPTTSVNVKYVGRLLDGTIFEQSTIKYPVGGFIPGWQIGVPLIQKGGKIRLLIPSALAYANAGSGNIPPNTVLDFDIELLDVTN